MISAHCVIDESDGFEGGFARKLLLPGETTGPDQVAKHTHPMLEQLFLGLPGNDVSVMADSYETMFGENELLHIPLGSNHGVKVENGKTLHYIWVDLFAHASEMDYMKDNHILLDE
jgi:hypothetical protein